MPVPDCETLMLPVLWLFGSGAKNVAECLPALKDEFGITDEEARELIPGGSMSVLQSRAHWARTYPSKAGLLHSPSRNLHVITDRGRALFQQNPARMDNATLGEFEGFSDWVERSKSGGSTGLPTDQKAPPTVEESQTPDAAMAAASAILDAALVDELGEVVRSVTPQRFERLIHDLLIAMGYGGGDIENGRMTKVSGDGGIDGIINENALGLDAVYVQAKRYTPGNTVGRPDIQRFIGEGANKGVFVTTSSFFEGSPGIHQSHSAARNPNRRRCFSSFDGEAWVGVRERARYVIKDIDRDYFGDNDVS